MLQSRYQGYFQLIDLEIDHMIHLTFFKEFLRELSQQESYILDKRRTIREKQSKKMYSQYHAEFENWKAYHTLQIQGDSQTHSTPSHHISLAHIHSYLDDRQKDQTDTLVKDMMNHLPMFYYDQEQKDMDDYYTDISTSQMSKDYLESLIWTSHYYFRECISWSWCTRYEKVPFLKDLSQYLQRVKSFSFETDLTPMTIPEQLQYIFPPSSHSLHPFPIQPEETKEIRIHVLHHRYLWECDVS